MRLAGEEDAVRQHLMEQLKPLCEAEPEVLADYVMVLVEKDVPQAELRENCIEELSAFLQDETEGFVNRLFSDLESKPWKKKQEKKAPEVKPAKAGGQPRSEGASLQSKRAKAAEQQKLVEVFRVPSPEPVQDAVREADRKAEGWDDLGNAVEESEKRTEDLGKRRRRENSKSSDEEDGEQGSSRRRGRSPVNDDRNARRRTEERGAFNERGRGGYDRGGCGGRGGRDDDRGSYRRSPPPVHGDGRRDQRSGVSGGGERSNPMAPSNPMAAFMAQMQNNFSNMPQGAAMGGMPAMFKMMAAMKASQAGGGGGGFPGGGGMGGMFPAGMPPPNMPPEFQAMFRQMQMQGPPGPPMGGPPTGMMPQGASGGVGGMGGGVVKGADCN